MDSRDTYQALGVDLLRLLFAIALSLILAAVPLQQPTKIGDQAWITLSAPSLSIDRRPEIIARQDIVQPRTVLLTVVMPPSFVPPEPKLKAIGLWFQNLPRCLRSRQLTPCARAPPQMS